MTYVDYNWEHIWRDFEGELITGKVFQNKIHWLSYLLSLFYIEKYNMK